MKKGLILLGFLILSNAALMAQTVDLSGYGGYFLGGKQSYYEGELKYLGAAAYGVSLDVGLVWKDIEFIYTQSPTTAQWRPYLGWENTYPATDYDVTVHYFQLGGVANAELGGAVIPFGTFALGATWFQSKDPVIQDETRFSVTLGGGIKVWVSDRVGIRAQGRLLLPMYFGGAGVGCGIGTGGAGCSTGVYASTNLLQGDFLGGVMIRLKGEE